MFTGPHRAEGNVASVLGKNHFRENHLGKFVFGNLEFRDYIREKMHSEKRVFEKRCDHRKESKDVFSYSVRLPGEHKVQCSWYVLGKQAEMEISRWRCTHRKCKCTHRNCARLPVLFSMCAANFHINLKNMRNVYYFTNDFYFIFIAIECYALIHNSGVRTHTVGAWNLHLCKQVCVTLNTAILKTTNNNVLNRSLILVYLIIKEEGDHLYAKLKTNVSFSIKTSFKNHVLKTFKLKSCQFVFEFQPVCTVRILNLISILFNWNTFDIT